jgi:hypothetical protein
MLTGFRLVGGREKGRGRGVMVGWLVLEMLAWVLRV